MNGMSTATDTQRRRWDRPSTVAAVAVVLLSTYVVVRLLGPMRLFADDWYFVKTRHDWSLGSVLREHAGHPVLLPAISYLVGFNTVGLDQMWWFKSVLITAHLAVCGTLAHRAWKRHGAVAGLAAWSIVCFMGAGAQNIVHFFQIGFLGSVVFCLLSLNVLDRLMTSDGNRDAVLLAVLLCAAVASSTVGMAGVLAACAVLAVDPRSRRHLWSPAVSVALYLAWRARYGGSTDVATDPVVMSKFLWSSIRDAGGAVALGNEAIGVALVAGLVIAAVRHVLAHRPANLVAGLLFTVSFWAMTTVSRAEAQYRLDDLAPSRYTYVAVVGLIVALADLAPPSVPGRWSGRARSAAVAVIAVGSVWAGHAELISTRDHFAFWGRWSAARLSVVDALPEVVPEDASFDPLYYFTRITIGDYLEISSALGTRAGLTPREFAGLSGDVLGGAEELALPLLEVSADSPSTCSGVSTDENTDESTSVDDLEMQPGSRLRVDVVGSASLTASRWLPSDPDGPGHRVLPDGSWTVSVPRDGLPGAWRIAFDGNVRVRECPRS